MEDDTMIVYVTKYAFTQGIWKCKGKNVKFSYSPDTIVIMQPNGYPVYFHGEGKEWHHTEEEAFRRVDEMRRKKIKFLEKQIEKLEDLIVRVKEIS